MNINKKFDRMKQWAGEKMGGETKTGVSDEFKTLEMEMNLRYEGMEKLQRSMTGYVKSISKRNDTDNEKVLPVALLGQTMIHHGEDFEPESEFGGSLMAMGRTHERIARIQEGYVANATSEWLESLERSLAQLKEYHTARKKLESRRLAYDASLSKMQKAKRDDFRIEEELRAQKAKYEESSEDVLRRMQDIKEAEADSVRDLGGFLDAELEYHERCREELLRLKRDWPAGATPAAQRGPRPTRSRSNTAHSYSERFAVTEEPIPEIEPVRPAIRAVSRVPSSSRIHNDYASPDSPPRPGNRRAATFQGPTSIYREQSHNRQGVPSDPASLRANLRPSARVNITTSDLFSDPSDDSVNSASSDQLYGERSVSPATSQGSSASRSNSYTVQNGRKAPPPPPSRAKKPPPPPPMKRSDLSTGSIRA